MILTRDQAIAEFRKMWNWIADETERTNDIVEKEEYFIENDMDPSDVVNECFLCHYDWQGAVEKEDCYYCPIDFGECDELDEDGFHCCPCINSVTSPYRAWENWRIWCYANKKNDHFEGYYHLAKYAREVANLPEREE